MSSKLSRRLRGSRQSANQHRAELLQQIFGYGKSAFNNPSLCAYTYNMQLQLLCFELLP